MYVTNYPRDYIATSYHLLLPLILQSKCGRECGYSVVDFTSCLLFDLSGYNSAKVRKQEPSRKDRPRIWGWVENVINMYVWRAEQMQHWNPNIESNRKRDNYNFQYRMCCDRQDSGIDTRDSQPASQQSNKWHMDYFVALKLQHGIWGVTK